MTPLRAAMIRDRHLQRLAPNPQKASVTAVAGFAQFSGCAPDQRSPDQMRSYLPSCLVDRRLAWSAWHQGAWGLQCFDLTTLGWEALPLPWPSRG
jgi:hypothetical protein